MATDNYTIDTILCIAIPLGVVSLLCILILLVLGLRFSCLTERIQRVHNAERLARMSDFRRLSASHISSDRQPKGDRNCSDVICCIPPEIYNLPLSDARESQLMPIEQRAERNQIANEKLKPKAGAVKQSPLLGTGLMRDENGKPHENLASSNEANKYSAVNYETDNQRILAEMGIDGTNGKPRSNQETAPGSVSSYPALPSLRSWGGNDNARHFYDGVVNLPYPDRSHIKGLDSPSSRTSIHEFATPDEHVLNPPVSAFQSPSRSRNPQQLRGSADLSSAVYRNDAMLDSPITQPQGIMSQDLRAPILGDNAHSHMKAGVESESLAGSASHLKDSKSSYTEKSKFNNRTKIEPQSHFSNRLLDTNSGKFGSIVARAPGRGSNEAYDVAAPSRPRATDRYLSMTPSPLAFPAKRRSFSQQVEGSPHSQKSSITGFSGLKPELPSSPSREFAPSAQRADKLGLVWNSPSPNQPNSRSLRQLSSDSQMRGTNQRTPPLYGLAEAESYDPGNNFESIEEEANELSPHTQFSTSKGIQKEKKIPPQIDTAQAMKILPKRGESGSSDFRRNKILGMLQPSENIHDTTRVGQARIIPGHSTTNSFTGSVITSGYGDWGGITPAVHSNRERNNYRESYSQTPPDKTYEAIIKDSIGKSGSSIDSVKSSGFDTSQHAFDPIRNPETSAQQYVGEGSSVQPGPSEQHSSGRHSVQLRSPLGDLDTDVKSSLNSSKDSDAHQFETQEPSRSIAPSTHQSDHSRTPSIVRRPDPSKTTGFIREIASLQSPTSPRGPGYQPNVNAISNPETHVRVVDSPPTKKSSTAVTSTEPDSIKSKEGKKRQSTIAYGNQAAAGPPIDSQNKAKSHKSKRINKPLPSTPFLLEEGVVANLGGARYKAVYSYSAKLSDELDLDPGDLLKVFELFDDGWCLARIARFAKQSAGRNQSGVCPRSCLSKDEWAGE